MDGERRLIMLVFFSNNPKLGGDTREPLPRKHYLSHLLCPPRREIARNGSCMRASQLFGACSGSRISLRQMYSNEVFHNDNLLCASMLTFVLIYCRGLHEIQPHPLGAFEFSNFQIFKQSSGLAVYCTVADEDPSALIK